MELLFFVWGAQKLLRLNLGCSLVCGFSHGVLHASFLSVIEFVATTLFVFNGCLSAVSTGRKLVGQGATEDVARILPIAFTFGISIMTLAYAIGHITGGHMNPAVSFLMFLRRQMSFWKMICYWGAQIIGSLLGSALLWGCTSSLSGKAGVYERPPFNLGSTTLDSSISWENGFLLEFMGSFFFFFVIAQTALDTKGIADSFFPAIPIGFSLIVVHICLIRKSSSSWPENEIDVNAHK